MKKVIICFLISFLSKNFLYATSEISSEITTKSNYKTYKNHKEEISKIKGGYIAVSPFSNDTEINWAKRFNIVELGGIDDEHITHKLLKNRKLYSIEHRIGYDWMPAFYYYTSSKNRHYVDWLYKNRKTLTLNPNGPFPHCKESGYNWCKDYYYNYGDKKVFNSRIDDLISNMKKKGFNGLFFDWASGGFILSKEYSSMKKYFQKLNPKKNYFKIIGNFYKTLKNRKIFIITNQAFRKEKYLLKYVTYDMTESYITTDTNKKIRIQIVGEGWKNNIKTTNYYPIYKNSHTIKDSLHFINLLTRYKRKYKKWGFKNFIYMNYIAPQYKRIYESFPLYKMVEPKNAIYFSYAMAKLTNNLVYAEIPQNKKLEKDNIYFYNLGKPIGKNYKKLGSLDMYVRFYTKGFVLASEAYKKTKYIKLISSYLPNERYIYDAYDKIWIKSKKHTVTLKIRFQKDTFTKKVLPTGRVYLYSKD